MKAWIYSSCIITLMLISYTSSKNMHDKWSKTDEDINDENSGDDWGFRRNADGSYAVRDKETKASKKGKKTKTESDVTLTRILMGETETKTTENSEQQETSKSEDNWEFHRNPDGSYSVKDNDSSQSNTEQKSESTVEKTEVQERALFGMGQDDSGSNYGESNFNNFGQSMSNVGQGKMQASEPNCRWIKKCYPDYGGGGMAGGMQNMNMPGYAQQGAF